MKLIAEQPQVCKVIEESVSTDSNGTKTPEYFLEGVFLQANIKNRNGRIYPIDIMKKEVDRYVREYVKTNRAFGELNHPADSPTINLDRVSHIITDIWQDGDYFKARAKILDTPCGRIVKAMIKEGCQLGVSSRALGSVTLRDGVNYVNDDFHLITAGDIVYEPSAQSAFPIGIINESLDWELDQQTGQYVLVGNQSAHCDCNEQSRDNDNVDYKQKCECLQKQLHDAHCTIDKLIDQIKGVKQIREFDNFLANIR